MLSPEYLERVPERLVELYAEVEADIIADMARRLSKMDFIPSAQWQYQKLIEMGAVHEAVLKKLSEITGLRKREIERLMKEAGVQALKTDIGIYKAAGLTPSPLDASPTLQSILQAGIDNTNGLFENLTRTTANTATRQFEHMLDRAWLQITTGAFDYNSAVRMAIKDLSEKGIASIVYPTGHTDYLNVAVRRAVVTGVNQTSLKLQETLMDEMGCDLVETSAHAGARPSHAVWQGKIFGRSGTHPKYPSLVEGTGYGTGEGLGGWNCRHSIMPFFEGQERTYTQSELDKMNAPKYEHNGEKLSEYEATQKQRYIERQIRRWKREYKAMEAAGLPTDEAAAKLSKWHKLQKDFIEQIGLKRQADREAIGNFSKADADKARGQAKVFQSIENNAIIKQTSGNPKKVFLPDEPLKATVNVDTPLIQGVVPKGSMLINVYVLAGEGTSVPIRDLRRLVSIYGGSISGWQKKAGDAYGENFKYVVHWYENNGIAPEDEFKLKGVRLK